MYVISLNLFPEIREDVLGLYIAGILKYEK